MPTDNLWVSHLTFENITGVRPAALDNRKAKKVATANTATFVSWPIATTNTSSQVVMFEEVYLTIISNEPTLNPNVGMPWRLKTSHWPM